MVSKTSFNIQHMTKGVPTVSAAPGAAHLVCGWSHHQRVAAMDRLNGQKSPALCQRVCDPFTWEPHRQSHSDTLES